MGKAKIEYTSPYSVGKRETLYIDANDPRIRGWKARLSAARAGAEIEIINDPNLSASGGFSSLKAGAGQTTGVVKSSAESFKPSSSNFIKPGSITNIDADWDSDTLVFTFDFDFADGSNKYVQGFEYELTGSGYTTNFIQSTVVNKTGLQQSIRFTLELNRSNFNLFQTTFSLFRVRAYDSFGNKGDFASFTSIPAYSNNLPAPVITVTAIPRGYSVDWESIPQDYDYISIEEVISNAATAPTTGWREVYLSAIKPANIIVSTTETRWVRARFSSDNGTYSPNYSTAYKITPESITGADTDGPDNVANVITTGGIDTTGYLGFNAYADISWPAVTGGGIRGYRIRFSNDNGTTYSYVDSPGTGTTYRLGGLAIGSTYKIAVATYDEYNNLSSSFISGPDVTVTGTPSIANVISAGPFELGIGVGGVSTNKGLYFDSSNYWYINASNSARLKVGGTTSNYLEWNGSTFAIDGNITARQGTFAGNVSIIPGGSLIAGTAGAKSVTINSNGLGAFNTNNAALTEILTEPITYGNTPNSNSTGGTQQAPLPFPINFFTQGAIIGGWVVGPSTIGDNTQKFILDSTNKRITITGQTSTLTNFTVSFGTAISGTHPSVTTTNIFEAGTNGFKPNFYITQNGVLHASNAELMGTLTTDLDNINGYAMKFGEKVNTDGDSGLEINSNNFWHSDGDFSIGTGILKGDHTIVRIANTSIVATSTGVTIGGNTIINSGEITLTPTGTLETDNNNSAGDPTLTLNTSNKITLGRRFIFNANPTTTPPPNATSWSTVTNTGNYSHSTLGPIPVKTGDILMVL